MSELVVRVKNGEAFWRRDVKWNGGETGKGNGQEFGLGIGTWLNVDAEPYP